jgi:hypothetical protein
MRHSEKIERLSVTHSVDMADAKRPVLGMYSEALYHVHNVAAKTLSTASRVLRYNPQCRLNRQMLDSYQLLDVSTVPTRYQVASYETTKTT